MFHYNLLVKDHKDLTVTQLCEITRFFDHYCITSRNDKYPLFSRDMLRWNAPCTSNEPYLLSTDTDFLHMLVTEDHEARVTNVCGIVLIYKVNKDTGDHYLLFSSDMAIHDVKWADPIYLIFTRFKEKFEDIFDFEKIDMF